LWYGVYRSAPTHQQGNAALVTQLQAKYRSTPLDDAAANDAGRLRADLAAAGQTIGPYDLLIAAIARSQKLTLVTNNTAEFSRVGGLSIDNWQ
jgi:tRNA(fMet)-specific endonuclease VapC